MNTLLLCSQLGRAAFVISLGAVKKRTGYFFISYSRKDYYFAESLAYSLKKNGVHIWMDTFDLEAGGGWDRQLASAIESAEGVILVGSDSSYKSENVREELLLASELKKPIFIARFQWSRVPGWLQYASIVNFSPDFERGVYALECQLIGKVSLGKANSLYLGLKRFGFLEYDVLAFFILFGMCWLYLILVIFSVIQDPAYFRPPHVTTFLLWYFVLFRPFARRKMGWNRLNFLLWFLFTDFSLVLMIGYFDLPLSQSAYAIIGSVKGNPYVILFTVYIAYLLCVMYIKQSPHLLRWLPTGTAPEFLRVRAYRSGAPPPAGMSSRFDDIGSFWIHSDSTESVLARRLSVLIQAQGGQEASTLDAAKSHFLLVTANTSIKAVESIKSTCNGVVYPVIGTSLCLHSSLEWFWKLQWIDFREWVIKRPLDGHSLPLVPESLTIDFLPARVYALYYSVISILVLGLHLNPAKYWTENIFPAGFMFILNIGIWCIGMLFLWLMLKRRMSQNIFLGFSLVGVFPFLASLIMLDYSGLTLVGWLYFLMYCVAGVVFLVSLKSVYLYMPARVNVRGAVGGPLFTIRPFSDWLILVFSVGLLEFLFN